MREKPRDKERLEHILEACNSIIKGIRDCSFEKIEKNDLLYYGLIKRVEIIGEATYKLTKQFKESHPEVAWDKIEGMRHVLVHDYFAIDINRLKVVVEKDIPSLQSQIQALYNTEIENLNF